jgi:hypothetical protein
LKATIAVAAVLAVVLAATSVLAVSRTTQLRAVRADQDELRQRLADAREQIDELEASAEGGQQVPDDLQGLEDLFGGEGGLGELFGDGDLGDLRDRLGELFGGEGGGLGELGDLGDLGDVDGAMEIAACVQGAEPVDIDDTSGESQFADIEQAVTRLRELEFTEPVDPSYLTQEQIDERITGAVEEDYSPEEADIDERYLAALGAIEPDLDLLQTQKDLLGGQVAGFYDSDTGEMVVGAAGPDAVLSPTDQVTLAHELTHAVTDQRLGLPELLDEETPDTDAALAALTLVEGDATLLMQRFAVSALDMSEQLGLAADPRAAEAQEQLQAYPHVLQRQLTFPYVQGLRFACALYQQGGWDALDAAYGQLPPTTAQVLFPERFGEPVPDAPRAPTAPGGDWDEARTDTLGAAELMWLFEAPGDDPQAALSEPRGRVAHWGGSGARLWTNGDETALGVALRDRGGPGPSLCDSVTAWYDAAFTDDSEAPTSGDERLALEGGFQSGVVTCAGDEVRLGTAPDLETARRIVG